MINDSALLFLQPQPGQGAAAPLRDTLHVAGCSQPSPEQPQWFYSSVLCLTLAGKSCSKHLCNYRFTVIKSGGEYQHHQFWETAKGNAVKWLFWGIGTEFLPDLLQDFHFPPGIVLQLDCFVGTWQKELVPRGKWLQEQTQYFKVIYKKPPVIFSLPSSQNIVQFSL